MDNKRHKRHALVTETYKRRCQQTQAEAFVSHTQLQFLAGRQLLSQTDEVAVQSFERKQQTGTKCVVETVSMSQERLCYYKTAALEID